MSEDRPEVEAAATVTPNETPDETPDETPADAEAEAGVAVAEGEGDEASAAKPPVPVFTDLSRAFYVVSVVPALLYAGALLYAAQGGSVGGYAGILLMVPIFASYVLGLGGALLVFLAKRRRAPLLGLVLATCVAGGLAVWFVVKIFLALFARSFLIDLGLY